jgi:hypothetical protein
MSTILLSVILKTMKKLERIHEVGDKFNSNARNLGRMISERIESTPFTKNPKVWLLLRPGDTRYHSKQMMS